ncbi:putative metabolite transport protein YwtG isoform X3 [Leptidea sinapis]|uniref:putative metabolite transport protein YwtG isoform X3 n=1 Tax=Leptidea sinapis TaxID=189913 RepID=UPI0021C26F5D|nr:putative metabolite transport protein YwtG isoform X3 [Leptidea sinapis]
MLYHLYICCIPLLLTPNEVAFIILHFLAGITQAGLFIIIPVYVKEISPKQSRGSMVSLMMMLIPLGYLSRLVLNKEEMMYTMTALVLMELVSVFLVIESPSYLVKAGKLEKAKINIAKLKCLTEEDSSVLNELNRLRDESERAKSNGNLTILRILKNKIWLDSMKIGFVLYSVTILCGSVIFLDQNKTLIQLKTQTDPKNILIPLSMFTGGTTTVVLIKFFERKYLLTFGYALMVLSMGVLAVFTQADLTVTSTRWLPVTSLGILVFAYGMVWALPIVIMVEMLNFEVAATLLGFTYTYSEILRLVHIHTIKYFEDLMGVHALFYTFAGINLLAAVYCVMAVPDIKDKSTKQIEQQLKRIPILKM